VTGAGCLLASAVFDELGVAATRFVELARRAPDPAAPVPATPGWTVADLVGHVAIETDRYAGEVEGCGEWSASAADIGATNARCLAQLDTRDVAVLTERIRTRVSDYVAVLASRDLDLRSHGFDGGLLLTSRQGAGVLLGELTIHGRDLAAATGRRAPLAAATASLVLDGVIAAMPAMLDPAGAAGVTLSVEIRVRGAGRRRLRLADGTLEVDGPRHGAPDVVISAKPVPFLLLSYGRIGRARALLGGNIVWGRHPHRAFLLDRLFRPI
jgi:uncharacterized protein (TIGR03083 family)